jgi:hypothetical protein
LIQLTRQFNAAAHQILRAPKYKPRTWNRNLACWPPVWNCQSQLLSPTWQRQQHRANSAVRILLTGVSSKGRDRGRLVERLRCASGLFAQSRTPTHAGRAHQAARQHDAAAPGLASEAKSQTASFSSKSQTTTPPNLSLSSFLTPVTLSRPFSPRRRSRWAPGRSRRRCGGRWWTRSRVPSPAASPAPSPPPSTSSKSASRSSRPP